MIFEREKARTLIKETFLVLEMVLVGLPFTIEQGFDSSHKL